MRPSIFRVFGGHLQSVLTISFVLVAILTVVLNTLVISRVINTYLSNAQSDRVARDMEISFGLYRQKLEEVKGIGQRAAMDPETMLFIDAALQGEVGAINAIDQVIIRKITVPTVAGSEAILVLDKDGDILIGRVWTAGGALSTAFTEGNWGDLQIVKDAMNSRQALAGTEIIPASFLAQVNLDQQALVPLRDTPQTAPVPFDSREGTAGLALIGVYPLVNYENQFSGAVVTAYMFNNEFSFVDSIKNEAQIETTTIFLGDLRVSTNVVDQNGLRAVGTRVSQIVYDKVLVLGETYRGRVFVVDDWYTGEYEPLRDHRNNVVGMLYAGVRESVFKKLVYAFNITATLVALVAVVVAGIISIPIARQFTRPIGDLAEANRRLARGDMNIHVQPYGAGEISLLGHSFNNMVDTLRDTQRELLHKEKLASMGQLAAGVAHELNNPLGTILLFADMMHKEMPADDARREDLKMIISEAKRCKVIVSDLLNFTRQQDVLAQDTDLHALIKDVSAKAVAQLEFEHIEIIHDFDPALPVIQADPGQLQQVFFNLFSNSADAMEGRGKITISTRARDGKTVEIRVTDTGSGISQENMEKLFTPFFTTKRAGKGTGLGLSIVYGIIKIHSGQIQVKSQPGQGTTIIITLPVHFSGARLEMPGAGADLIG